MFLYPHDRQDPATTWSLRQWVREAQRLCGQEDQLAFIKSSLRVYPLPPFRETLRQNTHLRGLAYDNNWNVKIPLHHVPNVPLGKVAERGIVRVHFPRMFQRDIARVISPDNLAKFYDDGVLKAARAVLGNMANHWPRSYEHAMTLYRDNKGQLHWGSLDVPDHLLDAFSTTLRTSLDEIGGVFSGAYFSHELRGWKGSTVHESFSRAERELGLAAMTGILDLTKINQAEWVVDVALEYGVPGHVVAWRKLGHDQLLDQVAPQLPDIEGFLRSTVKMDPVMLSHDLAGFRVDFRQRDRTPILYMQVYHTEKALHYANHKNLYSEQFPSVLLSPDSYHKVLNGLARISEGMMAAAGGDGRQASEGCARVELRMPLSLGIDTLSAPFSVATVRHCLAKVAARDWWLWKYYRLAACYMVLDNHLSLPAQVRCQPTVLTLGAAAMWIWYGCFRTPWMKAWDLMAGATYQLPEEGDENVDYPQDAQNPIPAMLSLGMFYLCDVVWDTGSYCYRIPSTGLINTELLGRVYGQADLPEVTRILTFNASKTGAERGSGKVNPTRNNNHARRGPPAVDLLRDEGRPLPTLPQPHLLAGARTRPPVRPEGEDIDTIVEQGGGAVNGEILGVTEPRPAVDVAVRVQKILDQLFLDVIGMAPNRKGTHGMSYLSIPKEIRTEEATEALFKTARLPFNQCLYKIVTPQQWELRWKHLFPSERRVKGQNYLKAEYWREYWILMSSVESSVQERIRTTLRMKLDELWWLPWTEVEKMWVSKKSDNMEPLPRNSTGGGPWIAMNPRFAREYHDKPKLRGEDTFSRGAVREEEEESE
ncbi:hypothetical protein GLOTRDRAFT_97180 [Gloeophyllum trabeum ATCC 11539]|uniref:Uncharacterized protein n=1 Tax=Gloeophyllum trabeum (strain ATCC 11539 / FP-39264 / Madison 617) TaxID=670483 RepID=S7PS15_GLOTA|nr:uncharacterized protein GLOTRDRAFT_97180 [Gloeophyllum trabeum ATCC 11539]EPQ50183.1 hypothetical protein GLOTRDRAFT_97180 [Gloeophyllum trabeum ATCC 11539]